MNRLFHCLKISATRWHAAGMVALLLSGCAGMAPPSGITAGTPMQRTAATRDFLDTIDLSGRLSVQYQRNGRDESVHGNFTWAQTPQHTVVTLLSPLGQTLAIIEITPTASTLRQSGQAPRVASDVDALVAEALGWPLPISGMHDWLQGFAMDANGRRFVAAPQATGSASVATSDGWRIRYASWQEDGAPPVQNRPKRIDLERSTAQAGDVSLRVVIDTWQPREH
jgi:outer membrane lipoprotein LolB